MSCTVMKICYCKGHVLAILKKEVAKFQKTTIQLVSCPSQYFLLCNHNYTKFIAKKNDVFDLSQCYYGAMSCSRHENFCLLVCLRRGQCEIGSKI